jgi:plasmid stabilization system protein ParE
VNRLLRLADAAETDLDAAISWYERQLAGLGMSFLLQTDDTLARIVEFPESYQIHFGGFRGARVRRFQFAVFYRIRPDTIEVDAILDCRMNPANIKARLGH